jgi:hypothetical protein
VLVEAASILMPISAQVITVNRPNARNNEVNRQIASQTIEMPIKHDRRIHTQYHHTLKNKVVKRISIANELDVVNDTLLGIPEWLELVPTHFRD